MVLHPVHKVLLWISVVSVLIAFFYAAGLVPHADIPTGNNDIPISEDGVGFSVVIDAGHGGMDGGATSENGEILEKDINLSVAEMLNEMLTVAGVKTVMTRNRDIMLGNSETHRKQSDLDRRVEICNECENPIFVSIHMNSFTQVKECRGIQIWYSPNNTDSSELAESLRSSAVNRLQPDNMRRSKPAGSNIYLLKKLMCPAVLCECGFLSNPEEAKLLSDPEYRRQIAFVIFCGIIEYINENGGTTGCAAVSYISEFTYFTLASR